MNENQSALLAEHLARYPQMQLQDILKLLYQSEFGCGHLIGDPEGSLAALKAEWADAPDMEQQPVFEPIGNGFGRLHLAAAKKAGLSVMDVHSAFMKSAALLCGCAAGYLERARGLSALIDQGLLPFDQAELDDALLRWQVAGEPLFRHSAQYREAYQPHYRVMREAHYKELLE